MHVTNANRVVFPDADITKGDVVAYYERFAPAMVPFLVDRPLTLQRFPKGLAAGGFMQKNAPAHYPDAIARFTVPKRDGGSTTYPVVHEAASLPYLANQGTITFHMWTSTATKPAQLDYLVVDLDPEEGDTARARSVTRLVGELLTSYGVASIPVATGSKGYHVWMPLAPGHDWSDIERTGRAIAGIVAQRSPDQATTEFLKQNRTGRVFIDWLRNRPGATVVVPYSLRPRPGAPVAVPIDWDELETTPPNRWSIGNVVQRLADPVRLPPPQQLPVETICSEAEGAGVDLDTRFDRFGRS